MERWYCQWSRIRDGFLWGVTKSEAECACLFIKVLGGTDSSLHRNAFAWLISAAGVTLVEGYMSTAQARVESGSVR
jgi:hypothetical protein